MVENRAVERFGRRGEPAGGSAIGVAWGGIAARMVVGEHDSGAAVSRRVGDDRADGENGAFFIAFVAAQVDASGLLIDMRDPQAFAHRIGVGEAAGKEVASGLAPFQFQRKIGTLISHSGRLGARVPGSHLNRVHVGAKVNRSGLN